MCIRLNSLKFELNWFCFSGFSQIERDIDMCAVCVCVCARNQNKPANQPASQPATHLYCAHKLVPIRC